MPRINYYSLGFIDAIKSIVILSVSVWQKYKLIKHFGSDKLKVM